MKIRESLLPMPHDMAGCRVDHRGYPVPWFVTEKDSRGCWDFVNIRSERFAEARDKGVCWVSGEKLGKYVSFVVGPMCVVNRVAGDPPVKKAVAEWSVRVCPFLANPKAHRGKDVPEIINEQRGVMLTRNPGVSAIYTTKDYFYDNSNHIFHLGEAESITWWAEGYVASPGEIAEAITSGLPNLIEMAKKEGEEAVAELGVYITRAFRRLPDDISDQTPPNVARAIAEYHAQYAPPDANEATDEEIMKYRDAMEEIYKRERSQSLLAE